MSDARHLSRDDLQQLAGRTAGLIVGPSATLGTSLTSLNTLLAEEFTVERAESFLHTGDALLDRGVEQAGLVSRVIEWLAAQPRKSDVAMLAKCRWSAVLSLSLDLNFEDDFGAMQNAQSIPKNVSVVSDFLVPPTTGSIPVYKILGHIRSPHLVASVGQLEQRLFDVQRAVRHFCDLARETVFVVGCGDLEFLMERIIAAMTSSGARPPRALTFLKSELPSNLQRIVRLCGGRTRVCIADARRSDVVRVLSGRSMALQTNFEYGDSDDPLAALARYSELVELVNRHLRSEILASEKNRLLDILFAPTLPLWDALVHNLDFRRTAESDLLHDLRAHATAGEPGLFIVNGSSATGKTMLLKRLSLELAKAAFTTLWFKRYDFPDREEMLAKTFSTLARGTQNKFAVAFVDDPQDLRIPISRLASAAANAGIRLVVVASMRSSDWALADVKSLTDSSLPFRLRVELDDEMDAVEWGALPEYLVRVGICGTRAEADALVENARSHESRDVLAVLYLLLPGSRGPISHAIRDEYFRLGGSAILSRAISETIVASPTKLRDAYEFIAVAESVRAPVPVEVLVSALQMSYSEWLDSVGEGNVAFGLFYSEDTEASESFAYRTRNWIVCDTIVKLVNAGSETYAGTVTRLEQLLKVCDGTHPAYREFVIRVLVPHKKLAHLDYHSGLRLYAAAQHALPFPDRTLRHHEALWAKEHGDHAAALEILEIALTTENYPQAAQVEVDEHIHTSIAAVLLDMLDQDEIDVEECKRRCISQYRKAASEQFFNPHAVHTFARLMWRIAEREGDEHAADTQLLLDRALADLDKTVSALSAPRGVASGDRNIEMLIEQRAKICQSLGDLTKFETDALALWESAGSQEGLAVLVRAYAHQAQVQDRGTLFRHANEAFERAQRAVDSKNIRLAPSLAEAGLLLYYHWQIRRRYRREPTSGDHAPDWEKVRSLSELAAGEVRAGGSLARYLYGLAAWHLESYGDAATVFTELRRGQIAPPVLWQPRDYLLNSMGHVAPVEGVITRGAKENFLRLETRAIDVHLKSRERWPAAGSNIVVYVEFSMGGPRAVRTPELRQEVIAGAVR